VLVEFVVVCRISLYGLSLRVNGGDDRAFVLSNVGIRDAVLVKEMLEVNFGGEWRIWGMKSARRWGSMKRCGGAMSGD
jgi:hypothetical protein